MTPSQTRMYFSLIGRVRDVYKGKGLAFGDVQRHALHQKALGVMKSSKDFTNVDLDKVKATILAIVEPGNLTAQLNQLDQPERRLGKLQASCWGIVHQIPKIKDSHDPQYNAEHYLDTIARSLTGRVFEKLDEKDVARVLGILRHRLGEKIPAARAPVPAGRESGDPSVPF